MYYHIIIDSPDQQEVINTVFQEVNQIFNRWNPHSEISALNAIKADEHFFLSPSLKKFFTHLHPWIDRTNNLFDPTIYPAIIAWEEAFETQSFPSIDQEIIGWDRLIFSNNSVVKQKDALSLDLSGVAKGYAIDLLAEAFVHQGFKNFYIEWGGEVRTSGRHPEKRPWRIGLEGGKTIEMEEGALATSGDRWQKKRFQGKYYTHIIDPKCLKPIECQKDAPRSVTILAPTCFEADIIATTAFLFQNKEEATAWLETVKKEWIPSLNYWFNDPKLAQPLP